MQRFETIVIALTLAGALPTTVNAQVLIDFEGWPELTPLSDQYAGVTFSTPSGPPVICTAQTGVYVGFNEPGYGDDAPVASGVNALTDPLAPSYLDGQDLTITFDFPVPTASFYLLDIDGLGGPNYETYNVLFYSPDELLLDARTITADDAVNQPLWQSVYVEYGGDPIRSIVIEVDPLDPTHQCGWAIDDLAYVPEPATLCLLTLGGLTVMSGRCWLAAN